MRSIFVSYKRNHEASERVVQALETALAPDFDVQRDVGSEPGKDWSRALSELLLRCDGAIAIVTPESIASDYCRREWSVLAARQQARGLPVVPVHLASRALPTDILDGIQAHVGWDPTAIERVRRLLDAAVESRVSPEDFLAAHHAWLRWQFREERVFGQEPYALKDVYIETECVRRR